MADYWAHWLRIGERAGAVLPRIYQVNWFRKGPHGEFLWPGYGENARVLEWIFGRCEGTAKACETPIGKLPEQGGIDLEGLDLDPEDARVLLGFDPEAWLAEVPLIREHYARFGDRVPQLLRQELDRLESDLRAARSER